MAAASATATSCARRTEASVAPARTRDETTVVSSDSMMSPFTAAIVSGRATLAFVRVSHAVVVRAGREDQQKGCAHG